MALTCTISKVWPALAENGLFTISVEAVLAEDAVEVRRETFSHNTEKTADVSLLAQTLIAKVQPWIDRYKTEKVAYNHTKMTTLVNTVQAGIAV